jgi:hypothetical protein
VVVGHAVHRESSQDETPLWSPESDDARVQPDSVICFGATVRRSSNSEEQAARVFVGLVKAKETFAGCDLAASGSTRGSLVRIRSLFGIAPSNARLPTRTLGIDDGRSSFVRLVCGFALMAQCVLLTDGSAWDPK